MYGFNVSKTSTKFHKKWVFSNGQRNIVPLINGMLLTQSGDMRILDPCAGEGIALAECQQQLGNESAMAFGIEFDEELIERAFLITYHS